MKEAEMTTIKIDDKTYDVSTLTGEAKSQLASIQFVDVEIARLQSNVAALQTARLAYSKALIEALPVLGGSDTLKI
jgi:hypothetical protein